MTDAELVRKATNAARYLEEREMNFMAGSLALLAERFTAMKLELERIRAAEGRPTDKPDRSTIDDMRRFNAMARKLKAARADAGLIRAAGRLLLEDLAAAGYRGPVVERFAAAIGQHAAPAGGIVAGLDALREAGGDAWDRVEDPGSYLRDGEGGAS